MKIFKKLFVCLSVLIFCSNTLQANNKVMRLCDQYKECCNKRNSVIEAHASPECITKIQNNHEKLSKLHETTGLDKLAQKQVRTLQALSNNTSDAAQLQEQLYEIGIKIARLKNGIRHLASRLEKENAQLAHEIFANLSEESKEELKRLNQLRAKILKKLRAHNISAEKVLGQNDKYKVLFI